MLRTVDRFIGSNVFIPPANFVCGGYTVFTLSVRLSIRATDMDLGAFLVLWR